MTDDKDFKRRVRERAARTGESYAAARRQLIEAREDSQALVWLRFAHQQLLEAVDGWWEGFRPTLEDLSDDEYLWEPAAGAATIRRRPGGRVERDLGGTLAPAPVATIGWLVTGMDQLLRMRTDAHFADRSLTWLELPVPERAEDGVRSLEAAYAAWSTQVRAARPELLATASEGPPRMIDGQFPFMQVLLHTAELLQTTGGQIQLLRQLYAQRATATTTG
jgi:hypothetical protein